MKKTLLILTALASLTIANVKAQYYNYDVTVHYDDFNETLRILHERTVELQQQKIQEFYNLWNYRLNKVQKAVWFYAVPGLRAAVAHNDWAAALSFWLNWESQEM